MAKTNIPLVGPTYTNRSLPVGAQMTQNFYVEVNQQTQEPVSLMPFPGEKSFGTAGTGKNRGDGELGGVYYVVSGTELYSVASNGQSTLIGTIPGSNRCRLTKDNSGNLVITNGIGKPYTYDGSTLTQGTDSDLPDAATSIYINDRVVYDSPNGTSFADLDTPLTVNSANVLDANTESDVIQAVIRKGQIIYAFGEDTIEPISFTGSGTPPYSRVNNSVIEYGTSSIYSVSKNKNFIYFLDQDREPARISGLTVQTIGNPAIGQAIQKYSDVSDCYTVPISFDNQSFVIFSFPTANASWLFSEQSQLWTSLTYGTDGAQHLISSHRYIYGKHLVTDRRNGNIYELDFDTFTDNGDTIQRRRDTVSISGRTFGKPGSQVFMNHLQLVIEPGASLVTAKATVMMQYSDDSGRTWSSERWATIGEQGDYTYLVEWLGLGGFYNRMFRFTMSDPIKWVLISANADVELGLD